MSECSAGHRKLKCSNVKRHFQMLMDNITYNDVYVTSRSKILPFFDINRKPTSTIILPAIITCKY